ncbi:TetR/AcrR family transcriptional regulator [Acidipila sp. EB88]|uniref:TetR/AcrR family transcriptional regulator n=1 Tax=Acidipila sp. EB88 TaxID=2305226 RepID=UPI00131515FD|nr:TetR/AcrR family transcriptional regulator [Acidipila sp. EB88]
MPDPASAAPHAEPVQPSARTERLTNRLVDAATQLFMEKGFDATSMVEIARAAHASKETFYRYFPTKSDLFRAVILRRAHEFAVEMSALLVSYEAPVEALTAFGKFVLGRILAAEAMGLLRILAMERERFPELRAIFHDQGPARVHGALAAYLAEQVARGKLRAMNPQTAARQFFDLCAAEMMMRVMRMGEKPSSDEIAQRVQEAVECFLHGYGA